jgi:hypothetical protein
MTGKRGIGVRGRLTATLLFVAAASPVWAHHRDTDYSPRTEGISIPNLLHGQMGVIAANRAAILELATRQMPTDPSLRRLQTFINLQFFACMWGIVPGSLDDENSPFNECTHAYLATTRALLAHLQAMPGDHQAVTALAAKIEHEMLSRGASLSICHYSNEPFNTAEIIGPHWTAIPRHLPSLIALSGCLALAATICGWIAARRPIEPVL